MARVRQGGQAAAKTFTRRSDAVSWARRVQVDMEAGRWASDKVNAATAVVAKTPTLREAIADYTVRVVPKMKSARDYRYKLADNLRLPPSRR